MRDRVTEIRTLYSRELRSVLRERNIVINSIILPILLYPVLLWLGYSGISFVAGQSERLTSRVVLTDLPAEHGAFQTFLGEQMSVEILSLDFPEDSLRRGDLDVAIEFIQSPGTGTTDLRNLVDDFRVRLLYDGSRNRSRTAEARLNGYLSDYRQSICSSASGTPVSVRPRSSMSGSSRRIWPQRTRWAASFLDRSFHF